VLLNAVNALAKIGNTLNLLWRDAKCSCCERWRCDDYTSAGIYAPYRAVYNQRKREKVLEDHAAGFSKAVRRRDPSVTEEQREEVSRRLLLTSTSSAAYQLKSVLADLFIFTFSLDARGGTARGVAWSDLAVRQLPAMFSEVVGPIDVLFTYITASKTSKGIVHNIGALGHVNVWLCPVGAMADAMVATFHAPEMDESRPPQAFHPSFKPTDAELRASGVGPTRYWAADQPYGFRAWYRVPLWPSARGNAVAQQQHEALTAQVSHLQEMVQYLAQGRTSAMNLPPSRGLSTPALWPCDGASPPISHGTPPSLSAPSLSAVSSLPAAASSAAPVATTAAPMLSVSSLVLQSAAFAPLHPSTPSRTLCADGAAVRDLRVTLKLEGVRVFDNGVRCVPLMGYESSSTWETALDEYAKGTPKRAALRIIEQQFGSLRRLREPDAVQRKRLINKHSRLSPLYDAFEKVYSERGRVVGVSGVLTILKGRWSGVKSSARVIREMGEAYLGKKKTT